MGGCAAIYNPVDLFPGDRVSDCARSRDLCPTDTAISRMVGAQWTGLLLTVSSVSAGPVVIRAYLTLAR